MPETPDFDQIARTLLGEVLDPKLESPLNVTSIVEQLLFVWNARGAADADLFTGETDDRDIIERIATLDR